LIELAGMQPSADLSFSKTPFIRLLLPLITGIILQWYLQVATIVLLLVFAVPAFLLTLFFFLPLAQRYRWQWVTGLLLSILLAVAGAWLTWRKDITHRSDWFGHHYQAGDVLVFSLTEPLTEKANSFKATATVHTLLRGKKTIPVTGQIIVYFRKDSLPAGLQYGSVLLTKTLLQPIKNAGNPGGFDYKRYCRFQGITAQLYLQHHQVVVTGYNNGNRAKRLLYSLREKVIRLLQQYIPGPRESALAEALLIGYKDDLDKGLLQSYSNTGVVHIIAVSGMHLALIYWVLNLLLAPLKKRKQTRWLLPLLVTGLLWLFTLLAGGAPSILRAAVMFSCIMLGQLIGRRGSIYNTLALSAFVLLCYNPFWLWDVGFQLSYAAVLSIVLFYKPVYGLLYIRYKLLDYCWQLMAVTIAAQLLTTPVSIFHFHQFPVYFLITNLLAVPLSSVILVGELLLLALAIVPAAATAAGWLLGQLIRLMNAIIMQVEQWPFALWDGLLLSIAQVILLYVLVTTVSLALITKAKKMWWASLWIITVFLVLRAHSFYTATRQQKLIVYNVPRSTAIDCVSGRHYVFIGDSSLLANDFARNFHLKPSRVLHRVSPVQQLPGLFIKDNYILFGGKSIVLLDTATRFAPANPRLVADLLIIAGKMYPSLTRLQQSFDIRQVVTDGKTPFYRIAQWKKECAALKIPFHDVNEQGAFVMNLR